MLAPCTAGGYFSPDLCPGAFLSATRGQGHCEEQSKFTLSVIEGIIHQLATAPYAAGGHLEFSA